MPDTDKALYLKSLEKFSSICAKRNVDGEIATHPCLDNGLARLDIIRHIVDGVPNPFVIGQDGYRYYEQMFFKMAQT